MGSAASSPTLPPRPAPCSCGVPVAEIMPGAGVRLEDGTALRSRMVLSNADPKVTLSLLDGNDVGHQLRRLEAWKVRSPVVKFNAALDRLPEWTAAPGADWPARATIDATGTIDEAQRAFEACAREAGPVRRDLHPDRPRPGVSRRPSTC